MNIGVDILIGAAIISIPLHAWGWRHAEYLRRIADATEKQLARIADSCEQADEDIAAEKGIHEDSN